MIEPEEAEAIVHDCIHEVVNTSESYAASKRLGMFGIIADEVVRTFAFEVRKNNRVGVRAYNHSLAAKELADVTSETLAGEVEDIIMEKAVEGETGEVIP
jgi:hypothetical protein